MSVTLLTSQLLISRLKLAVLRNVELSEVMREVSQPSTSAPLNELQPQNIESSFLKEDGRVAGTLVSLVAALATVESPKRTPAITWLTQLTQVLIALPPTCSTVSGVTVDMSTVMTRFPVGAIG